MDNRSFTDKLKLVFQRDWKNLYFPEQDVREYSLREMTETLLSLGDNLHWARHYVFAGDPVAGAIMDADAQDLCRRALECGQQQAIALKLQFGEMNIRQICQELGAAVSEDLSDEAGAHIRFAEFERPSSIRINPICIARTMDLIQEHCADTPLAKADPADVLLAHELFHYLEEQQTELFTVSYRHKTGRAAFFGPAKIVTLSEIGAGGFASELLALPYPSYLYDVVFTYCFAPKQASKLYEKIRRRLSAQP